MNWLRQLFTVLKAIGAVLVFLGIGIAVLYGGVVIAGVFFVLMCGVLTVLLIVGFIVMICNARKPKKPRRPPDIPYADLPFPHRRNQDL